MRGNYQFQLLILNLNPSSSKILPLRRHQHCQFKNNWSVNLSHLRKATKNTTNFYIFKQPTTKKKCFNGSVLGMNFSTNLYRVNFDKEFRLSFVYFLLYLIFSDSYEFQLRCFEITIKSSSSLLFPSLKLGSSRQRSSGPKCKQNSEGMNFKESKCK